MSESPLVNRIAESGLQVVDLETYFPSVQFQNFDIADYLFKGLILKEKEFREALKAYHWEADRGKVLLVFCSTDAILPKWAYMLVVANAQGIVQEVYAGSQEQYICREISNNLRKTNPDSWIDQRIMIKGCGEKEVPAAAYVDAVAYFIPLARSVMFGEPCSSVPVYKRAIPGKERIVNP